MRQCETALPFKVGVWYHRTRLEMPENSGVLPNSMGQLWDTQRQKEPVFPNNSQQSRIVKSLILLLVGVVAC